MLVKVIYEKKDEKTLALVYEDTTMVFPLPDAITDEDTYDLICYMADRHKFLTPFVREVKENGSIFVYTPKRPTVIYKSWPMSVHLVIIIVFLLFLMSIDVNVLTEFLHRLYEVVW